MSRRAVAFALALLISIGLVVCGVALISVPHALIVAGVLLALWAWSVLGEVETDDEV